MSVNPNVNARLAVAEIEGLMSQSGKVGMPAVESAHRQLALTITDVNSRLVKSHQLILAGCRREATETAEREPHLLDEVAMLSRPTLQEWERWSEQLGLPRFQALRADLASVVQQAVTTENRIAHLLRRHRRFALERANLRHRIAVLQQLSTADRGNPHWNESLLEYQSARLEQLHERVNKAKESKDKNCLLEIISELQETRWLTTKSRALSKRAQAVLRTLGQREAILEAIALSAHIEDASNESDWIRLERLAKRWRKIENQVDSESLGDLPSKIRARIEKSAQQRMAQQTPDATEGNCDLAGSEGEHVASQKNAGSTGLTEATEKEPNGVQLRRLRRRPRNRSTTSRSQTTKRRLVIGVGLIVAIAAVTGVYVHHNSEIQLAALVSSITKHLEAGELHEAETLLNDAPLEDERFGEQLRTLRELRIAEEKRVAEFKSFLAEVRSEIASASELEQFDELAARTRDLADRAHLDEEIEEVSELFRQLEQCLERQKSTLVRSAQEFNATIRFELPQLANDDSTRSTLAQWNNELLRYRTHSWLQEEVELLQNLTQTSDAIANRWESLRSAR